MDAQFADTVVVRWSDLLQLREALVTEVVWAPQDAVREVNEAIALADRLLGIKSPLNPEGEKRRIDGGDGRA